MSAGERPRGGGPSAPAPLLLLVGCPLDFVIACREAGAPRSIDVRACDVATARATAASDRPFAIAVAEAAYREAARAVDELARDLGAPLLRFDLAADRAPLGHGLLAAALLESAAEPGD
ncbi:MAG: hypothetical protein IT372_30425 [Polyangiaceae bacterium]|nr:hypothetical protein [Polyangiaceae bacterium]